MFYNSMSLNKREALAWAGFGMLDFYENRVDDSINHLRGQFITIQTSRTTISRSLRFRPVPNNIKKRRMRTTASSRVSRDTDDERRARIKGLINFLNFLGQRQSLYTTLGEGKTSVPFKLAGNRPVIQMKVNGHDDPLNFVLDTGSGISVISDETAKMLKIDPITKGGFAKGIGGDGKFEIIYGFLRQVTIGEVEIRNVPVYIRKFHNDGSTTGGLRLDGYIGLSLISKFLDDDRLRQTDLFAD